MMKIDEAQRLYNDLGYTQHRDPINWLLHQKEERTKWEEYKKLLEKSSHPLRKEILQDDYNKYREFMYENYPANFHNRLIFYWLDNAFGVKCNCKCDEKKICDEIFYIHKNTEYRDKYRIHLKILQIKRQVATLAKQRLLDSLNIPLHIKELPSDEWKNNYYQRNINLHSHTANELLEIYTNTLNGLHLLSDKLLWLKELSNVIRRHICNNYKYININDTSSDDDEEVVST